MKAPRGLTLIELVVALAVFALVAVMGLQTLTGTLRLQDRLGGEADRAAALAATAALLRADMGAAVPVLFRAPGGELRSAIAVTPEGLSLSRGGGWALGPGPEAVTQGQLQRADWRIDPATRRLTRRLWTSLTPGAASAAGPEVPVLEGVTGWSLRSYWPGQGWQAGLGAPPAARTGPDSGDTDRGAGLAPSTWSDTLPAALEITLQIDGLGPLRLLEVLR